MQRAGAGRRWWPAIAVLGVMLVVTLGGFVVAAALAEPAGQPVSIPGAVSVQPLSGWEPAEPGTLGGRPFVRLTRGNGTLAAVAWGAAPGDAAALATEVRDGWLSGSLDRLTASETFTPVTLDQGLEGQRFTFVGVDPSSGTPVEGEVTAVVDATGQGVVFVGLAPEGLLAFIDGDLQTMVRRATVGAP
ncbi:MAG: hypothetical protein ACRDHI_02340 [Actinomycetota bacterium]